MKVFQFIFVRPFYKYFLFVFMPIVSVEASLQVFPTRLFMGNTKRVDVLNLRHIGSQEETYRISTVFYRMEKDGKLIEVENTSPEDRSLRKYLKFGQPTVTLPPSEGPNASRVEKVVRVMVILNDQLPEGDYRAHIRFEPIGNDDNVEMPGNDSSKVSMKLSAKVAVAVPVFYVQGNPTSTTTISQVKLIKMQDKKIGFEAKIKNEGQKFVYAELKAWFTAANSKKPVLVGTISGVSSYINERIIQFPLNNIPEDLVLSNGKLKIELFAADQIDAKNSQPSASTEVELQDADRAPASH